MSDWFADTFYFLALRNPKDAYHQDAVEVTKRQGGRRLVTTSWVLTEVADALSAPANRQGFLDLLTFCKSDAHVVLVPCAESLFERGVDLFQQRTDKGWTLTDCISFVVMQERGLTAALTGDRHFEQAGFEALLRRA